jgi:hypothetical protein
MSFKKVELLTKLSDIIVIEVDYQTFRLMQVPQEEQEDQNGEDDGEGENTANNVGSTGGDETAPGLPPSKKNPRRKTTTKLQPTLIYHTAKYAMDLAFVEDKEIHMSVFVDD